MATYSMSSYWSVCVVVMATLYTVRAKLVDLSHDHTPNTTMATPDMPKFQATVIFDGDFVPGVYVSYKYYTVAEHGGTHIDAPKHFIRQGQTLEQIPLENTIADGVLIDCSKETALDPVYVMPLQKVKDWEKQHGEIPKKSAVLINFNWSHKFTNSNEYLGSQNLSDSSTFRYPSVHFDAVKFLMDERDLLMIGTDTMSPDSMNTTYPIHVALLGQNKIIVENLKDPGRLPPKGFRFHASPVKFVGGTGLQVRAFAVVYGDVGGSGSRVVGSSTSAFITAVLVIILVVSF